MEILGIGPLELLFIILLVIIILGPKDMEKTGRSIGQGLNKLVRSDTWKTFRQASDKVRTLPNELMREAGMEEIKKTLHSEIIQPAQSTGEPIDPRASGSRIAGSADPDTESTEPASNDQKIIAPPAPNEKPLK